MILAMALCSVVKIVSLVMEWYINKMGGGMEMVGCCLEVNRFVFMVAWLR